MGWQPRGSSCAWSYRWPCRHRPGAMADDDDVCSPCPALRSMCACGVARACQASGRSSTVLGHKRGRRAPPSGRAPPKVSGVSSPSCIHRGDTTQKGEKGKSERLLQHSPVQKVLKGGIFMDGPSRQGSARQATPGLASIGKYGLRPMEQNILLRRERRPQASSLHEASAGVGPGIVWPSLALHGQAWQPWGT